MTYSERFSFHFRRCFRQSGVAAIGRSCFSVSGLRPRSVAGRNWIASWMSGARLNRRINEVRSLAEPLSVGTVSEHFTDQYQCRQTGRYMFRLASFYRSGTEDEWLQFFAMIESRLVEDTTRLDSIFSVNYARHYEAVVSDTSVCLGSPATGIARAAR